jgi:nephrocystin-4
MYHQRRKFLLTTNNPRIIKLTHHEFDVPALAHRNIGIQVNSKCEGPGMKEVLLFINDEENRNEECYKIRVHVFNPDS